MDLNELQNKVERQKTSIEKLKNKLQQITEKLKELNVDVEAGQTWRDAKEEDQKQAFSLDFDYVHTEGIIEDKNKKLQELQEKIEKQKIKLEKQDAKAKEDEVINSEIPQILLDYMKQLEQEFYNEDMNLKKKYKELKEELGYYNFAIKYGNFALKLLESNDEKISKDSKIRAEAYVKDLFKKIRQKINNISDVDLHFNGRDLNGIIIGDGRILRLETITAGGYNIQRLHNRCLIKEAKY